MGGHLSRRAVPPNARARQEALGGEEGAMNSRDDTPNMDQLWEESVREAPRREAERKPWVLQQVCDAIRRARRGHNHMTAVHVSVRVPKCMSCLYDESRWSGALCVPEVYGPDIAERYAMLGFSRPQIQRIKRALEDRSWRPHCYSCGSTIDVIGEGFAVRHKDLSESFVFDPHPR